MTNNEIIEKIRKIDFYKGTNITRWKMRNYVRPQNDIEHEALVAHYAIYLCEFLDVDIITYRDAVALSVIHDDFEYLSDDALGDIPHSSKEQSKILKKFVEEHERKIICGIDKLGDFYKRTEKNKLAFAIMEFCDALDVLFYIEREFKLGNADTDFQNIYESAQKRVDDKLSNVIELNNKRIRRNK